MRQQVPAGFAEHFHFFFFFFYLSLPLFSAGVKRKAGHSQTAGIHSVHVRFFVAFELPAFHQHIHFLSSHFPLARLQCGRRVVGVVTVAAQSNPCCLGGPPIPSVPKSSRTVPCFGLREEAEDPKRTKEEAGRTCRPHKESPRAATFW